MVASYHKQYVPAYLRWLQQGKQGSGDATVDQLDARLDEPVILLFRRMAQAKLKAARAKAATAAAAGGKQPAQQQTWIGWLWGTPAAPAAGAAAAGQQQAAAAAGAGAPGEGGLEEVDTSMGVQEWNKLEELLADQAVSEPHLGPPAWWQSGAGTALRC